MQQRLGFSLEQNISNTSIHRARFTEKCSGLFQEDSLFKPGTSSASSGLHLLFCAPHWPLAVPGQADVPPPWTGDSCNEAQQARGARTCTRSAGDSQSTLTQLKSKEAIAATSVLREAMRHPKLHFQNLLSRTAFGGLWKHSIGLSSCLWSLVSFCAYSQIKWVSRPKGFKLIPPNKIKKKKEKNPVDPLKHFIWACKTTQGGTKYQRMLWRSSGNRVKSFISLPHQHIKHAFISLVSTPRSCAFSHAFS